MKDTHTFILWHYIQLNDYFRCFVADQKMKVFKNTVSVYRKSLHHVAPLWMITNGVGRDFEYEDLSISVNLHNDVYREKTTTTFRCNVNGLTFLLRANPPSGKIKRYVIMFGRVIKKFLKAYDAYEETDYA